MKKAEKGDLQSSILAVDFSVCRHLDSQHPPVRKVPYVNVWTCVTLDVMGCCPNVTCEWQQIPWDRHLEKPH